MNDKIQPGEEIPFEGAVNFRELGGYRSADGRVVKHGVFYRSGMLRAMKSEADRRKLESLGIRAVFDFRSHGEVMENPDLRLPGAKYYQLCALLEEDGTEMEFAPEDIDAMFAEQGTVVKKCDAMMEKMYARMPFQNAAFQKLFQAIEKEQVPLLFHCNAGKDRTGVAAMLILLALGVDEETALDDFELTNRYRRRQIEAALESHREEIERNPQLRQVFTMMEGVSRRAGDTALSKIKERYENSYEKYFEAEFGLNKERLSALRERYLV